MPLHATPAGATAPTIVLVHGAWADASSWKSVIQRLQGDNYAVVAPANPLRGLSQDSAYLAAYLETISGPIVLVGHSYGGSVISEAATNNPNVKALVYIAAFAPNAGESAQDLAAKFPGTHLTDDPSAPVPTALDAVPFTKSDGTTDVDLYLKAGKFRDAFFSDQVSVAEAAESAATQRPATIEVFGEPAGTPAWKTIPSWYMVAAEDRVIPPAVERFMAQRAHAHTVEINAPHAAPVTDPGAVADLVVRAAGATAE
jgi:pimeloyl-ACP methyl ester carboxylesterase